MFHRSCSRGSGWIGLFVLILIVDEPVYVNAVVNNRDGVEALPNPEAHRNFPSSSFSREESRLDKVELPPSRSDASSCFTNFVSGRSLFGSSIKKTFDLSTDSQCQEVCQRSTAPSSSSFRCTFYSFGYLEEYAKSPRCYLTDDSKRSLNTTVNARFSVFERQDYCGAQGRILTGFPRPRDDRQTLGGGNRRLYNLGQGYYYRNEENGPEILDSDLSAGLGPSQTFFEDSRTATNNYRVCFVPTKLYSREYVQTLRPLSQGEILNCDLTEQDTQTLDQYNSYDFYESAVTDFYERSNECGGSETTPATTPSTIINPNTAYNPVLDPDCYTRIRTAYKHYTYRDYKTVTSVAQCGLACRQTTYCSTFSYRYGTTSTSDIGNCLLSDKNGFELTDQDLVSTALTAGDWDVFDLKSGGRCEDFNTGRNDCYRRERVGYKHYFTAIRRTLSVGNVGDCSEECQRSRDCSSFSFRLDRDNFKHVEPLVRDSITVMSVGECARECHRLVPVALGAESGCESFSFRNFQSPGNCLISTVSVLDFDVNRDVVFDDEWELYQKLDGGAVCSAERCYRSLEQDRKHYTTVIKEFVDARDVLDCSQKCYRAGFCKSFSFRQFGSIDNCAFSALDGTDIRESDLRVDTDWNVYELVPFASRDQCGDDSIGGGIGGGGGSSERGNCFIRDRLGYKFYPSIARTTISVRDAQECSNDCKRSTFCKSFAFSYRPLGSSTNCQLTALDTRDIRPRDDILADADWAIYDQEDSRICRNDPGLVDDDECFRVTRRNVKFYTSSLTTTYRVQSVTECSYECQRHSNCRSFAFRVRLASSLSDNCQVSSLAPSSILIADIVSDGDWDIFEKLLGSRCSSGGGRNSDGECYRQIEAGYRHLASAYEESIRTRDKDDCSLECLTRRACNTFSYQYFASSTIDNCLLSNLDGRSIEFRDKTRDSNWDIFEQIIDSISCRRTEGGNSIDDCFERLKDSYKHRSSAARQYRDAFSIKDCETYCRRASYCVSFSFRDLTDRDNCILSDIRVTTSSDDFNLEYNRDWGVYRPIFGGRCDEHIGGGVIGGGGSIDRTGECFLVYSSGYRFNGLKIRETLSAFHIRDCENSCLDTRFFDCRSFSYRDGATSRNCDLTAEDPQVLNVRLDLIPDVDYKIYERRSSTQCRLSGGSPNPSPNPIPGLATTCSQLFQSGYRFEYQVVKEVTDARDSFQCEENCLAASRFRCTGFSFRSSSGAYRNCELTDRPITSLSSLTDIDVTQGWNIYERVDYAGACRGDTSFTAIPGIPGIPLGGGGGGGGILEVERLSCYNRISSDHTFRSRAILTEVVARTLEDCASECDRLRLGAREQCQAFSYRQYTSSLTRNCMLSDFFGRNVDSELERDYNTEVWEFQGGSDVRCQQRTFDPVGSGFSRGYSVSGKACEYGAELNPDVRYWYCRTRDDKGWDYCCRPGNTCGYSDGYEYPWCYVGEAGFDQWRPCSNSLVDSSYSKMGAYLQHAHGPVPTHVPTQDPLNVTNSLTIHHHEKMNGDEMDHTDTAATEFVSVLPTATDSSDDVSRMRNDGKTVNFDVETFEPVNLNFHRDVEQDQEGPQKTHEPLRDQAVRPRRHFSKRTLAHDSFSVRRQSRLPRILVEGDQESGLARVRLEPQPSPAKQAPDPEKVNFEMLTSPTTIGNRNRDSRRARVEQDLASNEEPNAPVPSDTGVTSSTGFGGASVISFG
ncbi:hypothetical protein TCAL_01423 [Tigriopus californicus]|uniref:Apple domain-containing protein n=1 Tax=Tigriopus californicus TaxID=6832 RepID=A0A553NSI5_TIGCA|nr:hypothetical protein TCAL_01423 [Tigriopus californicus]